MQLSAQNIAKRYGSHAALDGATFTIPQDVGTVILLGPSGSGKSTLLRILGSLLTPDAGEVTVDGQTLSWLPERALAQRRGNGFVFQGYNLFPHLSAKENVALPLRTVHGRPYEEASQVAEAALGKFGLLKHAEKKPSELSGGQQQRVALARAIAPQPRLLLLDEPTSALDPVMTQEVLDFVRALAESGQQIILSTHEISFARKVAQWVVFLDQGKVVESGPAEAFFRDPASDLAKRFLEALTKYR